MHYRILIEIYAAYSIFFLGRMSEELQDDYEGWRRIVAILFFLGMLPIGHIWMGLRWLAEKFEKYTALRFWYFMYFTKKFDTLEPHQLRTHQNIVKNHRNTNSIRDRYWRFCVKKIFERNNYNPEMDVNIDLAS